MVTKWQPLPIKEGGTDGTNPKSARRALGISEGASSKNMVSVKDFPFGAKGDGVTDDTAAIQAAINSVVAAGGGEIFFPRGTYKCASQLTIATSSGISLRGSGASGNIGVAGSTILYSGTPTPFFSASSQSHLSIKSLGVMYNNSGFTGTLVTFPGSTPVIVDGCNFSGTTGIATSLYLLSLDNCDGADVRGCSFSNSQYGLLGQLPSGTQNSNGHQISGCTFNPMSSAAIRNPGQGWHISGCVFEAGAGSSNKGKGIVTDFGTPIGTNITGCWFGDATDTTAWTWIQWYGKGLSIRGCYIYGVAAGASTGITISDTSSGVEIMGNYLFTHGTAGIALGAGLASDLAILANDFTGTTTTVSGVPGNFGIIQNRTATLNIEIYHGGAAHFILDTSGVMTVNVGSTALLQVKSYQQVYPGSGVTATTLQTNSGLLGGTGVPNNAVGNNGDIYFRADGGAGTTIYQRRVGVWVATAA